jgi:hypothetical protein
MQEHIQIYTQLSFGAVDTPKVVHTENNTCIEQVWTYAHTYTYKTTHGTVDTATRKQSVVTQPLLTVFWYQFTSGILLKQLPIHLRVAGLN